MIRYAFNRLLCLKGMNMDGLPQWVSELNRPEIIWFIIGLILALSEFAMPGFIVFFFGLGAALTGACCLFFDISLNVQLLLFVAFSLISLLAFRKLLKRIFIGDNRNPAFGLDEEGEYIGHRATVITKIEAGGEGKIEFHGSNWIATSSQTIEQGASVIITAHKNLVLEVKPA